MVQHPISVANDTPPFIIDDTSMSVRSLALLVVAAIGACLLTAGLIVSRGGMVDALSHLALGLAVVLTAAAIGGHVAVRLGQPAVLGELLAGIVLGNLPGVDVFRTFGTDRYLDVLAQVGVLLLLFEVGLGLSVRDLFAVGASSFLVAALGTIASLTIGTAAGRLLLPAAPLASHVFLGAALAATSVGITARVLRDMNASRRPEAKIILGAAVVDDVLALVVLGGITAWVAPAGEMSATSSIVGLVLKTSGFLIVSLALGA